MYICNKFQENQQGHIKYNHSKKVFKDKKVITILDLLNFYKSFEPGIKETTLNWRIYTLVQMGVLNRIGRGKYVIGVNNPYIPEISKSFKTLNKKLTSNFPYLDCCIWNTSVFNEFMLHQPFKFYNLVEVEKEAMESVFFFMKENKYSVFIEPDLDTLYKYTPEDKETWIVKSLVTEAPIQEISGIKTATIEKMLVDIFCDPITFNTQQESEKDQIFKEAFNKYTINENTILRYANRRRKKKELDKYLNRVSKFRQQ